MKTPTGEHTYTVGAIVIDYTSDQGSVIMDREIFVKQFLTEQVDTFHVYLTDRQTLEQTRAAITAKLGKRFDLYVLSNVELREEATQAAHGRLQHHLRDGGGRGGPRAVGHHQHAAGRSV